MNEYVLLFQITIRKMPAVTRVGDADAAHCSGMSRAQGSPNVFCNGRPISRQGDKNTTHLKPGSPCHLTLLLLQVAVLLSK